MKIPQRYFMLSILLLALPLSGCFVHRQQTEVLIPGIDVNQTLEIAELELQENKLTAVLTYWAVRDQVFTPAQAAEANRLYFAYIDKIDSEDQKARTFAVWHLTWAVSNIFRLGDDGVKEAIGPAYHDASVRVAKLDSKPATQHFNDEEMLMGDIHFMGRGYAKKHLVVPGNEKYVQSADAYRESREENN